MKPGAAEERLSQAEVFSIFGAPDMDVLAAGRRKAVLMPPELFGDAWPLMVDIAAGCGAPVDYVALGFIVASASLIGGKRRVQPYATTPWSEPCILWGGAVGDPSSRKSPALDAVTSPLSRIDASHAAEHGEALKRWQADSERAKLERQNWQDMVKTATKDGLGTPPMPDAAVEPDEPMRRRSIVMDATPEALGWILSGNPAGTLHYRDELAGWLTSFDRYSPGGREFWLESYGGRPFVIDRKGTKGAITIPFNGVSVLGSIQPEKMAGALLGSADDGLVARILWAWPERIPYSRPQRIADIDKLEDIYRALSELPWGTDFMGGNVAIRLRLSDAAADLFEEWAKANEEGVDDCSPLYKSFAGKMDGALLRLSLASELVQWAMRGGAEPTTISARTVAAAAKWVDDYAKPMAMRVYGDASLPPVERNAAILARYILKNRFSRINKQELKRSPHKSHLPTMRTADPMDEALRYLCDAGWLIEDSKREGATPGRKRGDYIVNPAIYEAGHA
jgi:hypothetical protein